MKNLQIAGVLTILILAIVMISGCTNNAGSSGVPITPTVTGTQDPIIGVWRFSSTSNSFIVDSRYRLNADNTFESSISLADLGTVNRSGNWIKTGSNTYVLDPQSSSSITIIYSPSSDSFYESTLPKYIYTHYQGDVAPATVRSSTPVVAPIKDPIIGVWRNYASNSSFVLDERYRFDADKTFNFSLYATNQGTITLSGTWKNQGDNIYVLSLKSPDPSVTVTETLIYNSSSSSFYQSNYPKLIYTRYVGAVMTSLSTPRTTTTSSLYQKPSYQGRVTYSGNWRGTIVNDGDMKTISGTGTMTYDIQDPGNIIVINGQKLDGSSQRFSVEILKNGNVMKSDFTDTPYGLVQITFWT